MDLRTQLRFDADPVTVFAMLTDEEYIGRKVRAANAIRHEVSVIRNGDQVTIKLLRVMPPDVPDFVRRFVGDTIDLQQTDVWAPAAPDGTRTGTIAIDMVGAPVTLRGTLSLTPDGPGSLTSVAGKIKASVPFVGGKIEQAVHSGLIKAAEREEQVGRDWLSPR
ncbi:MAG TPA: DUF2505 domain-containing protein [Jiangellales bacterium]|nr:DUF2505 domain-containing protein [Jiangellales bacterium]